METYLLVLYATLEQETAVRRLYDDSGWTFNKIDYHLAEIEAIITKEDIKGPKLHQKNKTYVETENGNVEKATKTRSGLKTNTLNVHHDNYPVAQLEEGSKSKKKKKLTVKTSAPNDDLKEATTQTRELQKNNSDNASDAANKETGKNTRRRVRKTLNSSPHIKMSDTTADPVIDDVDCLDDRAKDSNIHSLTVKGRLRVKIKPTNKNSKQELNEHRKTKRMKLKQAENINEKTEHNDQNESKPETRRKRKIGSTCKSKDTTCNLEKTKDKTRNEKSVAKKNKNAATVNTEKVKVVKPQTTTKSSKSNIKTDMTQDLENMENGEKYSKEKHLEDSVKTTNVKKSNISKNDRAKVTLKNEKLSCPDCPRIFLSLKRYERHRQHHTNQDFDCKECGKKFINLRNLRAHMFNRSINTSFECDICKFKSTTACLMRKHRRENHPRQEIFQCHLCAKIIKTKSYLNVHLKEIHQVDDCKYECHICGKKCHRPTHFARHMAIHESGYFSENKCNICEKVCETKIELRSHMRVHKERKFLCSDCGKGFITKSKLEAHTRVHSGFKPHKCDQCSYRSTQAGNVRSHMKIHNKSQINDSQKRSVSTIEVIDTARTQLNIQATGADSVEPVRTLTKNDDSGIFTPTIMESIPNSQTHPDDVVPVLFENQTDSVLNRERNLVSTEVTKTKGEIDTDALQRYPEFYRLYENRSSSYVQAAKHVTGSESNVETQQIGVGADTCSQQQDLTGTHSNNVYGKVVGTYPQHTEYSQAKYTEVSSSAPLYVEAPKVDIRQPVYALQGSSGQLINQTPMVNQGYPITHSLAAPYGQQQEMVLEQPRPAISEQEHLYIAEDQGVFSKSLTTLNATSIPSIASASTITLSESTKSALTEQNKILYENQQSVYQGTVQKYNEHADLSGVNQSVYPASTQNVGVNTFSDPVSGYATPRNVSMAITEQFKLQPVAKITDLPSDKLQMLVYAISNNPVTTSYAITNTPVTSSYARTNTPVTSSYAISNPPVKSSYAISNPPVTSYAISNPAVTSSYAISNNPMTSSYAISTTLVTTSYAMSNPPVTSSYAISNPPVTSSYAISNPPVTSSYAISNPPVTSSYAISNPPVTSSYAISNPPVTSYAMLNNAVITSYSVLNTAATASYAISNNPVSTSSAMSNTPVPSLYTISNIPVPSSYSVLNPLVTSYALSNTPVTTSYAVSNTPVTTSYAISNTPVTSLYAISNPHVTSSYAILNTATTASYAISNNTDTSYAISNNPVTPSYNYMLSNQAPI